MARTPPSVRPVTCIPSDSHGMMGDPPRPSTVRKLAPASKRPYSWERGGTGAPPECATTYKLLQRGRARESAEMADAWSLDGQPLAVNPASGHP